MTPSVHCFNATERISFGEPATTAVIKELDRTGSQRVFVLGSRSVAMTPSYQAIVRALGSRCVGQFTSITAHVPQSCVLKGAQAARAAHAARRKRQLHFQKGMAPEQEEDEEEEATMSDM